MASCLLDRHKEEASSNLARVQEVLQKKLRKNKNLGKSSGQAEYGGPKDTQRVHRDGGQVDVTRGKAEDVRVLGAEELLAFERQGHLSTRGVLSEAQILTVKRTAEQAIKERSTEALQHRIRVLLPEHHHVAVTSAQQGLHLLQTHHNELGFLQHFNLHRYDSASAFSSL